MSDEDVSRLYALVKGADVEAVSDILKTKLNLETLSSALDVATAQLEGNDDVDRKFQICSELLSAGAQMSFNAEFKYGPDNYNLIQHCCKHGNIDVLKQALDQLNSGSKLIIRSSIYSDDPTEISHSHSPWGIAVRAFNIDCIQLLYEYCGENRVFLKTSPALKYAVDTGELCQEKYSCANNVLKILRDKHYECAKLLINQCSSIGELLCLTDKEEEWDFILTNMNKNESAKAAARHVAAEAKYECLKYILQDRFANAVDLNNSPVEHYMVKGDEKSVLFHLIQAHEFNLIEQLLKYNVDMNSPCGDIGTPFEIAIRQYCDIQTLPMWKIIRALVSHGCDTTTYAISWVPGHFRSEILQLLLLTGVHLVPPAIIKLNDELDEELDDELLETMKITITDELHPLKHLARLSIRRALTTNQFGTVPKLSGVLPPTLINYLMLPEIDDIEAMYQIKHMTLINTIFSRFDPMTRVIRS